MEETSDPLMSIHEAVSAAHLEERPHTVSPADTMRPPPLPAHILATETKRESTPSNQSLTSRNEASQALEVVLSFIEQQPPDFLNFEETKHVLKLMDKLKLHSRAGT